MTQSKPGAGVHPGYPVQGTGLGLRRPHLGSLLNQIPSPIQFMEVAPENWMSVGGRLGRAFAQLAEQIPMVCHGLLLNLGGPDPIDIDFLRRLKPFLTQHRIRCYGDHLSFCADQGQLYELLPLPFTFEAASYIAARIRLVQDILEQRIAVENASYYCALAQDISEVAFINEVLAQADCQLLLDVNNLYVNSQNHGYDPLGFLNALPPERIAYAHIAGHWEADDGLLIDTHGAPVVDPVWQLLRHAYERFGVFPTLLERDENIPALGDLLNELALLSGLQAAHRPLVEAGPRRV